MPPDDNGALTPRGEQAGSTPQTTTPRAAGPSDNSTKSSTADPISEAPNAVWYVRPPSGGQYGPASADVLRRWVAEGRVTDDSLVWREGWANWQTASSALHAPVDVDPQPTETEPIVAAPAPAVIVQDDLTTLRTAGRTVRRRRSTSKTLTIVVGLGLVSIALLVGLVMVITR